MNFHLFLTYLYLYQCKGTKKQYKLSLILKLLLLSMQFYFNITHFATHLQLFEIKNLNKSVSVLYSTLPELLSEYN